MDKHLIPPKKKKETVHIYSRGDGWAVTSGHDTTPLCWCNPVKRKTKNGILWVHREDINPDGGPSLLQPKLPSERIIREALNA